MNSETEGMFITDNRTGCRFITVEAYSDDKTINFYEKNNFDFYLDNDTEKPTRIMYFDLLRHKIIVH